MAEITVPQGNLELTATAAGLNTSFPVSAADLALTPTVPTILQSLNKPFSIAAANLAITTVASTQQLNLPVLPGELALTTFAVSLDPIGIFVTHADLDLTTSSPTLRINNMNFLEERLPTALSLGIQGGPLFSTTVVSTKGGHEKRNQNWSLARDRYNLAYAIKKESDWATVIDLFRNARGRLSGFRLKDWSDYKSTADMSGTITATDQLIRNTVTGLTVGDGTTKTFQLQKTYTFGAETVARDIVKPVSATTLASVNDVSTVLFSIDLATGIITFDTAPGNGLNVKAGFEFDVPVRFDIDWLPATLETAKLASFDDIPLLGIRDIA